mgnify:CR=1 FL=1
MNFQKSSNMLLTKRGKVHDIYEPIGKKKLYYPRRKPYNYISIFTSDRVSAFDRYIADIPNKGLSMDQISKWWFSQTKEIVPNHVLNDTIDQYLLTRKCKVFPIEFVMRAYLTGTTKTSIWKNYEKGIRNYCGYSLPDDMTKNQQLPEVILTPTTKGETDIPISEEEIIKQGLMTKEQFEICKEYSYKLFEVGQTISDNNGLTLVDTKYEFGIDQYGEIVLVDELHTPDSSRYWAKGPKNHRSFDKEILRKYISSKYEDPYDLNQEIYIPKPIVNEISQTYVHLYHAITGKWDYNV